MVPVQPSTQPAVIYPDSDGQRFLSYVEIAQWVEAERQRAEAAAARATRLANRLRELGIDPELPPIQQGKQPFAPTVWPLGNRGRLNCQNENG